MKRQLVAAFGCGLLFAVGLALSGMTDPGRVLGFRVIARRAKPVLEADFAIPKKRELDRPLILGSALFGVGWGLSGYCPGPVVTSVAAGGRPALAFAAGMVVGMVAYRLLQPRQGTTAVVRAPT